MPSKNCIDAARCTLPCWRIITKIDHNNSRYGNCEVARVPGSHASNASSSIATMLVETT